MAKRIMGVAAMLAALLAGCSQTPAYRPPVIAAPPTFKEAGPWQAAAPADLDPKGAWWAPFGDPTLNALEARVDSDNPTLAGALGRYDEARAYLSQTRSALFPQIGIDTQVTDNRQSNNRPLRGANQPDLYPADTLGGDVSYELDLWGRVRSSVAAGRAEAQASADDLAAIRLSLETQLALAYMELRGFDAQSALLAQTVDAYAQADAMTGRRFRGGISSQIDVSRSGTQLAEARAQLADVQSSRALDEHAIASLVGILASSFSLAPSEAEIALPALATGLPSTLLERRPDIAAAERRMAAANEGIGVARAAFFPRIGLDASGGFQNTGLANLVSAPNLFWSVGPSLVLNLFDGGRRGAQLAVARAIWTQSTASYRERVLRGFQEVEDALAQLHHLGDEAAAEEQAVAMASQAEAIALNLYRKGATDYLDVVTAQATALRTRRAALDLRARQLRANIRLIEAIGGGWDQNQTVPDKSQRLPLPHGADRQR